MVSAAGGYLYKRLVGKLPTYPIPEIRLYPGSGQQLLDIGCNWGRWTISAAEKGYSVTGIDPDLGAVLTGRKVAEQLGIEARFMVADARYLPFPENSFQIAFSYSVLQHFSRENVQFALSEIRRVLTPGGTALIQMPNKFGVRSLYHQAHRVGNGKRGVFRVRYWSPGELKETFSRLIGPSCVSVDGFFGLGIQPSDLHLLPPYLRLIVISSEALRKVSRQIPALNNFADSLYITATKATLA